MPRPKEFDPDSALDKAMQLFLKKGYKATSMHDLIERMGVHRGSLYATFGNKQDLFLSALERFVHCVGGPVVREATSHPSAIEGIRLLFDRQFQAFVSGQNQDGCLLANTAAEITPAQRQIGNKVSTLLGLREEWFRQQLKRAQREGELDKNKDIDKLAKYLNTFNLGLSILIRTRPDSQTVRDTIDQGLAVLG